MYQNPSERNLTVFCINRLVETISFSSFSVYIFSDRFREFLFFICFSKQQQDFSVASPCLLVSARCRHELIHLNQVTWFGILKKIGKFKVKLNPIKWDLISREIWQARLHHSGRCYCHKLWLMEKFKRSCQRYIIIHIIFC